MHRPALDEWAIERALANNELKRGIV
jgi:hypothetical protein